LFQRWGVNSQAKTASDREEMKRNILCGGRDFYLWRRGSAVQPFNAQKLRLNASGEVRGGKKDREGKSNME